MTLILWAWVTFATDALSLTDCIMHELSFDFERVQIPYDVFDDSFCRLTMHTHESKTDAAKIQFLL